MDPLGARSRRAREKGNLTIVNQIVKARAKGRAREAKAMSCCPPSLELKMTLFIYFFSFYMPSSKIMVNRNLSTSH